MKRIAVGLLFCLFSGCPKAPAVPPPATMPGPALGPSAELVQIDVKAGQKVRLLGPRDVLRGGDEFALTVNMAGPGYVYLLRTTKEGAGALVYPTGASAAAPSPAGAVRIPAGDGWITLPDLDPTDRLCLVFSAQLVGATLPRCGVNPLASGSVERGGDEEPPPPPPDKTDDRRGSETVRTLRLPVPKAAQLR